MTLDEATNGPIEALVHEIRLTPAGTRKTELVVILTARRAGFVGPETIEPKSLFDGEIQVLNTTLPTYEGLRRFDPDVEFGNDE